MAQTRLILITTLGTNTGPLFDLYSNADNYFVPFETNITAASLTTGYISVLVPDGATIIRVKSKGVCQTFIDLPIPGITTTTSTTTIRPTTTSTTSTTTIRPTTTTTTIRPTTTTTTASLTTSTTTVSIPTLTCTNCSNQYSWTQYSSTCCVATQTVAVTLPTTPLTLSSYPYLAYSDYGTQVYSNFNIDGTGTVINTLQLQNLWRRTQNTQGQPVLDGPLNRCGKWPRVPNNAVDYLPLSTWVGFSVCLTGFVGLKTYYVGIGADNHYRLVLDGVEILNTTRYVGFSDIHFKWWHVYPVQIGAGSHVLEVYGWNNDSIASFGCEIYNNTLTELVNATQLSNLNIIFTTQTQTTASVVQSIANNGNPIYISNGYTCPNGYVYSSCSNTCVKYIYCCI